MSELTSESPRESARLSASNPSYSDEKTAVTVLAEKKEAPVIEDDLSGESDRDSADVVIITGADAADHLLPLRDDFDSALTFRSIVLASILSCFQAVMYQIYIVCQEASCLALQTAVRKKADRWMDSSNRP